MAPVLSSFVEGVVACLLKHDKSYMDIFKFSCLVHFLFQLSLYGKCSKILNSFPFLVEYQG